MKIIYLKHTIAGLVQFWCPKCGCIIIDMKKHTAFEEKIHQMDIDIQECRNALGRR